MDKQISRRDFVKAGSGTAALLASTPLVYAGGQDQTISVGLIGCGGRGTGAAENCLESSQNVKLVGARRIDLDLQLYGYKDESEHSYEELEKKFVDSGLLAPVK